MSRDIRFRVWVESILPEETGLYYPDALTLYKGEATMVADRVFADKYKFKDDTCKFTLMQYTGVKDSLGNEIYEGDIIRNLTEMMLVVFENGCFEMKVNTRPGEYEQYAGPVIGSVEVVGNIFEHPELLK